MLTTQEIMSIIPHRYPFLLIDQVIELEAGRRALGEKLVTINEPFFQGHFPAQPIMPGVLIIEALAQVGAVAALSLPEYHGKLVYLAGIDHARFRRPVYPGSVLRLETTLEKFRHGVARANARATVEDQLVCEATLLSAMSEQT